MVHSNPRVEEGSKAAYRMHTFLSTFFYLIIQLLMLLTLWWYRKWKFLSFFRSHCTNRQILNNGLIWNFSDKIVIIRVYQNCVSYIFEVYLQGGGKGKWRDTKGFIQGNFTQGIPVFIYMYSYKWEGRGLNRSNIFVHIIWMNPFPN